MKRTHKEVMKSILKALSDGKSHVYGNLERKANTNWQTVRDHCEMLELFGAITMNEEGIRITAFGNQILRKMQP